MLPANFNQLYYFWVIAKEGSISAASRRLLRTQSTLSLQLKQLERGLGRRLLSRGRGGVAPTPAGRLSLEYCERIFGQAEELLAGLRSGQDALRPVLRLGVTQSISRDKVLQANAFIRGLGGGLGVKILAGVADVLEQRLERRLLDVVLSDTDLSARLGRDFRSRLVGRVPHYLVGAPSLRARVRRFPRDLEKVPFLMRAPENPIRKELDYFLHRHGISPVVQAETDDPDLIRIMAVQGQGVCAMDLPLIRDDLAAGRLARLHARPIGLGKSYWAVGGRRKDGPSPVQAAAEAFMDRFRFRPGPGAMR